MLGAHLDGMDLKRTMEAAGIAFIDTRRYTRGAAEDDDIGILRQDRSSSMSWHRVGHQKPSVIARGRAFNHRAVGKGERP